MRSEQRRERDRNCQRLLRQEMALIIQKVKDCPCADCSGYFPQCIMEFDHVRGDKKFNIAGGFRGSMKQLREEIAKCDVVCANCHRLRHFFRRQGL